MRQEKSSTAVDLRAIHPAPDCFERLLKLVHKQEQAAKFGRPKPDWSNCAFGRQAVQKIISILAGSGYDIYTTPHKAPFDLWIGDVRIEVKVSRWINPRQHPGRYQAAIRNHKADLILFDALNGSDHWFVIPMNQVAPRKTIEITSYDVCVYSGRWAEYLEAWHLLAQAVEAAKPRVKQLSLME